MHFASKCNVNLHIFLLHVCKYTEKVSTTILHLSALPLQYSDNLNMVI